MNKTKQSKHKNLNGDPQQLETLKKGLQPDSKKTSAFGTKEFAASGKGPPPQN